MMIVAVIHWGAQYRDVSHQLQSIIEQTIPLSSGYALKGELLGFYAGLDGLSRSSSQPNETALVSGQLTRVRRGEVFSLAVDISAIR
ncbi:Membrane-associated protein uidC precursor [Citrobacter werkmanii]|nr:Membrane-associated protein uidC precursor [Citrobacter werkmanii]